MWDLKGDSGDVSEANEELGIGNWRKGDPYCKVSKTLGQIVF